MADTAPTLTNGASASNGDATRGLAYYEKLRRDLRDTLNKKRILDKNLSSLEDQIHRFENSYLEETSAGNIVKGFDHYVKGSSTGSIAGSLGGGAGGAGAGGAGTGGGAMTTVGGRRRGGVSELDRVFSRSSASYMRDSPAPTPSSAQTTPSHAPTPTASFANRDSSQPASAAAAGPATNGDGGSTTKNPKKSKKGGSAAASTAGGAEDGAEEDGTRKRMKFTFGGRAAGVE